MENRLKVIEELYSVFVAKIELNRLTNEEMATLLANVFLTFLNSSDNKKTFEKIGVNLEGMSLEEILGIQKVWIEQFYIKNPVK